jgi:hypothetical protein
MVSVGFADVTPFLFGSATKRGHEKYEKCASVLPTRTKPRRVGQPRSWKRKYVWASPQVVPGLKPESNFEALRGAEAPLFHGCSGIGCTRTVSRRAAGRIRRVLHRAGGTLSRN